MTPMNTLEPWYALLPESVQELIQVIGWADTIQLITQFGGTTLPMPSGTTSIGRETLALLSDTMGEDVTETLAAYYGGAPLYIPRCATAIRRARNNAIIDEFENCVRADKTATSTVTALALKYKLTDRRIWTILKVTPPNDQPAELFESRVN